MLKRLAWLTSIFALLLVLAACNLGETVGSVVPVATTGDTAADAAAAQRFLPNIGGYLITDADSLVDALAAVAGGAALLTADPIAAAVIAQIDGMIQCYQEVGAAAAKIYVQADIGGLVQGQVPNVGAMAVINSDRIANNFLPCALGQGPGGLSAQSAPQVQICSNSGQFTADGENLWYVYAATNPDLCAAFQSGIPAGRQ